MEHIVKVLLDSGSKSNLITSKMATILGLSIQKSNFSLTGISQFIYKIIGVTFCKIKSRVNDFSVSMQ